MLAVAVLFSPASRAGKAFEASYQAWIENAASDAAKTANEAGMRSATVYVKGPGAGREAAIRAVDSAGIKISRIFDVTPVPHNGCRPPKKRRV